MAKPATGITAFFTLIFTSYKLKHIYHYDRLVVFGDGENDIEMFQLANEAYAVNNAHEKLKAIATQIIPSNDQDGVAQFLKKAYQKL